VAYLISKAESENRVHPNLLVGTVSARGDLEAEEGPDDATLECLEMLREEVKMIEAALASGEPIYPAKFIQFTMVAVTDSSADQRLSFFEACDVISCNA